jgi:hypothetical protein
MRRPLLVDAYWFGLTAVIRRDRFLASAGSELIRADDSGAPEDELMVAAARRALDRATKAIPIPLGCLQRTLVLHRLLARRGVSSTPAIGVRRIGGRLEAHAWLEHRGRILTSSDAHCRNYQRLRAPRDTTVP